MPSRSACPPPAETAQPSANGHLPSAETRPRSRVDSRDVAALAGVSQSTVSRVLSGDPAARVSPETRRRVVEAARTLNYVPNRAMADWRRGRSERVGVLMTHPSVFGNLDPYHAGILGGIARGAYRAKRDVVLHSRPHPHWRTLYDDLVGGSSDGVLIVGPHLPADAEQALIVSGYPSVFISYAPDTTEPYHAVDADNVEGGRLAVEYLLVLGHRHIGLVGADLEYSYTRERTAGARAAAAASPFQVEFSSPPTTDAGAVAAWLRACPRPPTALFFLLGETLCRDFLSLPHPERPRVPADLSVISFDSTAFSENAAVPVTSIYQPVREVGQAGMELAVQLIDGETPAPGMRRLPVRLDVRASTAAPPRR